MAKLDLNDLSFAVDDDSSNLGNLKERLQTFQYQKDTGREGLVKPVLSKSIQQKIDRKVAFKQTTQDVSKWKTFINQTRQSEHVDLSSQYQNILPVQPDNTTITRSFKPQSQFESKISQILQHNGLQDEREASKMLFDTMQQSLSPHELQARHAELSGQKSMLFFHEHQLQKVAKVQSGGKYQKGRKDEKKMAEILKSVGLDETLSPDQEALLVELERAHQRVTQKRRKRNNYLRELLLSTVPEGQPEELEQEDLKRKILEIDEAQQESGEEEERESGEKKNPTLFEKLLTKKSNISIEEEDEHFEGDDSGDELKKAKKGLVTMSGRFSMNNSEGTNKKIVAIPSTAQKETESILNVTGNDNSITFDSQRDLIKRAFATDNVVSEFQSEKVKEVEQDLESLLPKPVFLPGWGSWSGNGARESKSAVQFRKTQAQEYQQKKKQELQKRKDFSLSNVIINERAIASSEKYVTDKLPFPYKSKEHYEMEMNMPVGREWNTFDSWESNIKPKFEPKSGAIINPPDLPERKSCS